MIACRKELVDVVEHLVRALKLPGGQVHGQDRRRKACSKVLVELKAHARLHHTFLARELLPGGRRFIKQLKAAGVPLVIPDLP